MRLMPRQTIPLFFYVFLSSCGGGVVSTAGIDDTAGTADSTNIAVSSAGLGIVEPLDSLGLRFVTPPIELSGTAVSYASDVAYDVDALTTFDIFLPESAQPTGAIIYVHGGGFTGGDKSAIYEDNLSDHIRDSLAQGVAFATINYRLLGDSDSTGVIKSLSDSRRALQFIRHHASELNIDPARIAMYGESAGAGTSLWLAYHDDMGDLNNADPVLRHSTRIAAVGALETQASYDITRWENDVFPEYGITLSGLQALSPELAQRLLSFYGASSSQDLDSDAVRAYREDVDLLGLMSVDDPDTWLKNAEQPLMFPISGTVLFHHAFHARELLEQANRVGLNNVSYIPELGINDASGEDVIPFLVRHIQ